MQVREVMSRTVQIVECTDTLQYAAQLMAELDAGVLPVSENDELVGMVTDRDIAIRGDGRGRDPTRTTVREVMTREVRYCFGDEKIEDVADNMAMLQVRRLPVLDHEKHLIGIVSLGDVARRAQPQTAGAALREVCQQSAQHSQTLN